MRIEEILSKCDHTLLRPDATWDEIKILIDEGIEYKVASICIPPAYVGRAVKYSSGKIPITTVVGFPHGNETTETKVYQAKNALNDGADEIDMVINIGELKSGNTYYVLREIEQVREVTKGNILKIIIETSMLSTDEKVTVSRLVSQSGADYIKTSTGFGGGGAIVDDVLLIKGNIGAGLKIKASGGIRSLEEAKELIESGASRLGTSRIVKIAKDLYGED